ncbi:EAL domain-containing protein [Neptunicoccus sediminis]|uniref:EAL domain-containing protein n=1 Tax=Neptunicoccus sediminis TaxID=1892596 RepID=UPI0009F209DC|nr:EAL domain-containing protein [Neptunicoccus sediminis]
MIEMVREAIKSRNVMLAYQPIVHSKNPTRPAYYEGLIRVLDAKRRIIPAQNFIGAVETMEIGRILDCLSLELGLVALAEEPTLRLAINMSARSIGYPHWMETLNRGLAMDKTIAERLILEVTESSAMLMPDIVNVFMGDLHRRGISFALDDFGAGYTAFRFFRDFQFDIVKIDGQFIRDIHKDVDNQVLTAALIAIAHQFDMFTVAECVEKKEELAYLQEAGIDCLQGYLLGRPETVPVWKEDETPLEGYI